MLKLDLTDPNELLAEYAQRVQAGEPSGHDRANAALLRADQAASILAEGEHAEAARTQAGTVARFAALAAELVKHGAHAEANRAADRAEAEALKVDAFDSARFEGLLRYSALEAGGGKRAAQTS